MKNLKKIFILVFALMLVIPFSVFAEGEDDQVTSAKKKPVPIYLFHGATCPHCLETIEWFESIEEEYGDYFDLVKFEVWNNQTNAEFMQVVANKMGDDAGGVPYMVVGKYSYPNGFAPNSPINDEGTTMAEDMISKIMETYNEEERTDVMDGLDMPTPDKEEKKKSKAEEKKEKEKKDAVVGIVSVVIIGGIVALAFLARKNNKED